MRFEVKSFKIKQGEYEKFVKRLGRTDVERLLERRNVLSSRRVDEAYRDLAKALAKQYGLSAGPIYRALHTARSQTEDVIRLLKERGHKRRRIEEVLEAISAGRNLDDILEQVL